MLSLGVYPVVGLKEARDKNFLLRQQITQGINPALERKKEKSQIKEALRIAPYVFLQPGSLTWGECEIDWQQQEWRIPGFKMKNNKPHVVPLARQVVEHLENLRRYTGEGQYLLPSYGKSGHLTTNSLLKAIHVARYGSKEFTSHGFRHMAVTLLKELGFPHDVIYLQRSHTLERDAAKAASQAPKNSIYVAQSGGMRLAVARRG